MKAIFENLIKSGSVKLNNNDADRFEDWLLISGYRHRVMRCTPDENGITEFLY